MKINELLQNDEGGRMEKLGSRLFSLLPQRLAPKKPFQHVAVVCTCVCIIHPNIDNWARNR